MSKFAKFLDKTFKVKNDEMGIPSIINVEGEDRSLIQSIDRNHMLRVMTKFLKDKVALSDEVSNEEAWNFIDGKYKEYKDFVMNL